MERGVSAPQLHQPASDARCRRAGQGEEGSGSRERTQGQTARGGGGRGGGGEEEEGCPPRRRRIALYPPSFPLPTEAASHRDIYERAHKREAEGRQKKKKKENTNPTTSHSAPFPSFSFFKEQMCCGLQTEKDTPLLVANFG